MTLFNKPFCTKYTKTIEYLHPYLTTIPYKITSSLFLFHIFRNRLTTNSSLDGQNLLPLHKRALNLTECIISFVCFNKKNLLFKYNKSLSNCWDFIVCPALSLIAGLGDFIVFLEFPIFKFIFLIRFWICFIL